MLVEALTKSEQQILLELARQSIERAVSGEGLPELDLEALPARLREDGAAFVTLTYASDGALRGCIGGLEPRVPLAQDVCEHAAAAALDDYRFLPVTASEVPHLHIEISVLTSPQTLQYDRPADLPGLLRPYIDGVTLRDGFNRATYLPQVWEKLPVPHEFLSSLCTKMGAEADLWMQKVLHAQVYQVIMFEEAPPEPGGQPQK